MAAPVAVPVEQRAGEFMDSIDPGSVLKLIRRNTGLLPELAEIVATYVTGETRIGVFGPTFWQSRGINAGAVRPIAFTFYGYWHGPDPVDPTRRVCDTHHRPVWIPKGVSLADLERVGLQLSPNDTAALRQHKNTSTHGEYYAVMRKEILGRNLHKNMQIEQLNRAGYRGLARAAEVAAVIFAVNLHDGSRWLGNHTGAERRQTYTRCVEEFESYATGLRSSLGVGDFNPFGLHVGCSKNGGAENIGVAAIRRF